MAFCPWAVEAAGGRHELCGHRRAAQQGPDAGQVAPEGSAVQGAEAVLVHGHREVFKVRPVQQGL